VLDLGLPRRSDVPTYAYACTTCDHRFEVRQSFSDSALTECPECTGKVRKLFNTVGIVFKGSGFYRTDSRNKGKPDSGASSESAASKDSPSTAGNNGSTSTKDAGPAGKRSAKAASKTPAGSSSAA
jgi:putative FmdB family regulatory protein